MCVGIDRVREATARQLLKEFGEITFKEGENINDFSLRITDLANNIIRIISIHMDDADVVNKMPYL